MSAKKRPKVPRELVGLFYRLKWIRCHQIISESECPTLATARQYFREVRDQDHRESVRHKLYRVTVWRKKR